MVGEGIDVFAVAACIDIDEAPMKRAVKAQISFSPRNDPLSIIHKGSPLIFRLSNGSVSIRVTSDPVHMHNIST